MSRTGKILVLVALLVAAAIAVYFWSRGEPEQLAEPQQKVGATMFDGESEAVAWTFGDYASNRLDTSTYLLHFGVNS